MAIQKDPEFKINDKVSFTYNNLGGITYGTIVDIKPNKIRIQVKWYNGECSWMNKAVLRLEK